MTMMSTPQQRKLIGYFRKLLKMPEDVYKEILWTWHVDSSRELTVNEAETLLCQLKKNAIAIGVYEGKKKYSFQKYRHNSLDGRDGKMATPAQLRKVEAMWFEVSRQPNDIARAEALHGFLKRITGKERLQFLTKTDISKLIKAMETMKFNMEDKKLCL